MPDTGALGVRETQYTKLSSAFDKPKGELNTAAVK